MNNTYADSFLENISTIEKIIRKYENKRKGSDLHFVDKAILHFQYAKTFKSDNTDFIYMYLLYLIFYNNGTLYSNFVPNRIFTLPHNYTTDETEEDLPHDEEWSTNFSHLCVYGDRNEVLNLIVELFELVIIYEKLYPIKHMWHMFKGRYNTTMLYKDFLLGIKQQLQKISQESNPTFNITFIDKLFENH